MIDTSLHITNQKINLESKTLSQNPTDHEKKIIPDSSPEKNFDYEDKLEISSEATNNGELTEDEQSIVEELKRIDRETKAHEMAHLAAAAGLSASGPHYEYTTGPDNQQYAVGGEVHIDNSEVPGDPEATIRKMQQVQAAALAPSNPSPQDRSVAAAAARTAAKAQAELTKQKMEEMQESVKVLSKEKSNPISERIKVEYSNHLSEQSLLDLKI